MSALDQLILQYREKNNIQKSRKRQRDSDNTLVAGRTTKGKTEKGTGDVNHIVCNTPASCEHHNFLQNDV